MYYFNFFGMKIDNITIFHYQINTSNYPHQERLLNFLSKNPFLVKIVYDSLKSN